MKLFDTWLANEKRMREEALKTSLREKRITRKQYDTLIQKDKKFLAKLKKKWG